MRDDFAIFIPSYDRCEMLIDKTLHMLKKYNYSGKWFVVVDDNDPQLKTYKEKIPEEHLLIFHKPDYYDYYDTCFNKKNIEAKLYPVAFIDSIIDKLKLNYYMIIDDDMKELVFRYDNNNQLLQKNVSSITFENFLNLYIDFLDMTCYTMISIDSNAKLMGGLKSEIFKFGYKYDLLSIYILKNLNDRYKFCNLLHDEASSLQLNALNGRYTIMLPYVFFVNDTLKNYYKDRNDGGCSSQYNTYGISISYIKEMALLMTNPNCIELLKLKNDDKILYTRKNKKNYYPKIIDGRWKK